MNAIIDLQCLNLTTINKFQPLTGVDFVQHTSLKIDDMMDAERKEKVTSAYKGLRSRYCFA